jgi:aminoglycoside 3-N-acetyltransferase
MFLDSQILIDQLQSLAGFSNRPLLVHTDLLKVGLIEKMKRPEEFLKDHLKVFETLAARRPLWFPCFNYDFCKDGLFDLQNSPSQVGAFPDFLRRQGYFRSHSPIFSFVIMGPSEPVHLKTPQNVFGPDSSFARLLELNGDVLFWGAPFSSNTFFHLVEENLNIGYRYLKRFQGTLKTSEIEEACQIDYRVRPRGVEPFLYDWDLQEQDLRGASILKVAPAGNTQGLLFNTQQFSQFISKELSKFPLKYLKSETQDSISEWKKKRSYPFQFSDFEGPAVSL